MSTGYPNRTLQIAYPFAILLAVIAAAGLNTVRAHTESAHFYRQHNDSTESLDWVLASSESDLKSLQQN